MVGMSREEFINSQAEILKRVLDDLKPEAIKEIIIYMYKNLDDYNLIWCNRKVLMHLVEEFGGSTPMGLKITSGVKYYEDSDDT